MSSLIRGTVGRPPVKLRSSLDDRWLVGEFAASRADHVFELVEVYEVTVRQRLVQQRPELFSGLKLRAVWRLEDEVNALGYDQVVRRVPPGPIDDQGDTAPFTRTDELREVA